MSLSRADMREIFSSKLSSDEKKKTFELSDEAKKLFTKRDYLGYFPTIEEAEIPDIERKNKFAF